MDEYVGGIATNYMTNENMLNRGLELLKWLEEDLENVGAEDYHQLMRAWELKTQNCYFSMCNRTYKI